MGFMDKAKEAADDLKASFASTEVRDSEQAYRDLGMLAYLTATGRPIDEADRQRVVNTLWAIEQQGKMPAFRLLTSAASAAAAPAAGPPGAGAVPPRRPCLRAAPRRRPRRAARTARRGRAGHPADAAAGRPTRRQPAARRGEAPGLRSDASQAVTWCTKHQRQSSSGSADCMTGCWVSRKCPVACRITEESQQPMCPQSKQIRSETHV